MATYPTHRTLGRSVLLGVLALCGLVPGCTEEPPEGDFLTPPGFSEVQTQKVAMGWGSFVRDENQRLLSSTVLARRHERTALGLDPEARRDTVAQRNKLEAVFHGTYADGLTVSISSHPGASLRVVPTDAQPANPRLRKDGAVVSFENAFPSVTSAYGGRDSKLEEFLVIHSENDIPSLAYDLFPGDDFARLEEEDGRLWAYAKDGAGLFTIEPPFADDAAGKHVSGSWKLISNGSGYRIVADINLRGLQFPVLLDPTFEVPRWFRNTTGQPAAKAAAAGAFDLNTNCSLVFGGATNANFELSQELSARCADRTWGANLDSTNPPPARAYAAMAYHGGSTNHVFLFGGYGSSVLNDLWRANLTCTTPGVTSSCSVAWTQIATTGGPSARYLHGMAWNGSRLMVFGGVGSAGQGLRDTWEYDADTNTWTEICNDCFGGSFGIYGFASTTLVNGGTRTVYASGGYNNPTGGGAFLNSVYRWNGSAWEDVSGNDASIPVGASGTLQNGQPLSPSPRYLHWMAATGNNSFLFGSGLSNDGVANAYYSDYWLWQDRTSEGLPQNWLRAALPSTNLQQAPGERESATAIYDENLQEVVLLGGLTSIGSIINHGRTYRPAAHDFTLTQSCTNNNDEVLCDGNQLTLTLTFPGLTEATTPKCSDMQGLFVRLNDTGSWAPVAGLTTAAYGSSCTAAVNTAWDPVTILDYGVRVRDKRYVSGGSDCSTTGSELTDASPTPGCLGLTSTMGSASCGFALDPSFSTTSPCDSM